MASTFNDGFLAIQRYEDGGWVTLRFYAINAGTIRFPILHVDGSRTNKGYGGQKRVKSAKELEVVEYV